TTNRRTRKRPLRSCFRLGPYQRQNSANETSSIAPVYLERVLSPTKSPVTIQGKKRVESFAHQNANAANVQKQMSGVSIVIRMDPTANIGARPANNSVQNPTRSENRRRANRKMPIPVTAERITAKNLTPNGFWPNKRVPTAMNHAITGPLSK